MFDYGIVAKITTNRIFQIGCTCQVENLGEWQ